jgi:hypothetical protein
MKVSKGKVHAEELDLLMKTIKEADETCYCNDFVELGTAEARTSVTLKELIHPRKTYWGVDPYDFAEKAWNRRIGENFFKGYSWEFALGKSPASFAWCFVDTCHCYQCASREIRAWTDKIGWNGFLVFHDTAWAINSFTNKDHPDTPRQYGVLSAVVENLSYLYKNGFILKYIIDHIPRGKRSGLMAFQRINDEKTEN